ncbi:ATP-binding protein [Actinospica sp. MGRD01-02]|uniref:ATP-binding protein n=1 Tax=Actinospica acidithermotolerans TaxID=2828514 RepID=A0A941EB70_9ACTN|nr:ATP-binding protein [Actinospica acidithermotolerans]MBR7824689.1 ATP-binding protein [Actinospica acidithermotolerans]
MTPHTPTGSEPNPNARPAPWRALSVPLPAGETHLLAPLRRIAAANLAAWGLPQGMTDDVLLALTELAANGLRHTSGPVRVHMFTDRASTYVQVEDTSATEPPRRNELNLAPERTHGFGLEIIEALASGTVSRVHAARGKTITAKFNH